MQGIEQIEKSVEFLPARFAVVKANQYGRYHCKKEIESYAVSAVCKKHGSKEKRQFFLLFFPKEKGKQGEYHTFKTVVKGNIQPRFRSDKVKEKIDGGKSDKAENKQQSVLECITVFQSEEEVTDYNRAGKSQKYIKVKSVTRAAYKTFGNIKSLTDKPQKKKP